MFKQYCLGIDISVYQTRVDWALLYEAGVRFAIIRSSCGNYIKDIRFLEHLSGARKAGMICGAYHYFVPGNSVTSQLDCMRSAAGGHDLDFVALDVEQYWIDWNEKKRNDPGNHYKPQTISQGAKLMAKDMSAIFKRPVVIYTRASFVNDYAGPMSAWLPEWPLWLAQYPYPKGRVTLDWKNLKEKYEPMIKEPMLPKNCREWKFWQFSGDKFVVPGVNSSPLDLNFYHGSEAELREWLGLEATVPREYSMEEKVKLLWEAHPEVHG